MKVLVGSLAVQSPLMRPRAVLPTVRTLPAVPRGVSTSVFAGTERSAPEPALRVMLVSVTVTLELGVARVNWD